MIDDTLSLFRLICMSEGFYPKNKIDVYNSENMVQIIFDCKINSPEIFKMETSEEQTDYMV